MAKILIVEDDENLRGIIADLLSQEHHMVEETADGSDARDKLTCFSYDLVILDWQLPQISGLEILREFRSTGALTPVLMLTGKKTISEKEQGLDSGADDYLTKPFHIKELAARVRALLRRAAGQPTNVLRIRDIVLEPDKFMATSNGKDLQLQRKEFALLEFLMRHPRQVFSTEALLERVWASETDAGPDAVRTCLKKLRAKIDTAGRQSIITTVHGVGYRLDPD